MPVRFSQSAESVSQSSESLSGSASAGLEPGGSWNSHVLAGDTMLFSAPSLESLYIINSFEEPHSDMEVSAEQLAYDENLSPKPERKEKANKSMFGSWFGSGSKSSQTTTVTPVKHDRPALERRSSCDILLYAAPAPVCDNFTDARAAYEARLFAPASEPDTASPVLSSRTRSGVNFDSMLVRDVVLLREDRQHSYGMYLRATRDGRVLCTGIDADSPAAACGLQVGDELVWVNGFCVKGWPASYAARVLVEGDLACKLTILHNPRLTEKLMAMGAAAGVASASSAARGSQSSTSSCPGSPRVCSSAELVSKHMIMRVDDARHNPLMAEENLGVEVHDGRVHSVDAGSPAEAAGLVPGDIIVAVGKRDVTGCSDDEIVDRLRKIKGFFSISTVPEDKLEDYLTLKTTEELMQAAH